MSQNKKIGNMAAAASLSSAESLCNPIIQPHDYRECKIGENTRITIDLEDLKKRLSESQLPTFFTAGA